METIEVVIRIPKKCKEFLDNGGKVDWLDAIPIIDAIADGVILPKGHGRLIDADKLIDTLGCSNRDIYCKSIIEEDAPTIIEADTESEENK